MIYVKVDCPLYRLSMIFCHSVIQGRTALAHINRYSVKVIAFKRLWACLSNVNGECPWLKHIDVSHLGIRRKITRIKECIYTVPIERLYIYQRNKLRRHKFLSQSIGK